VSWSPGERLGTTRNADYWQVAPDGEPHPYLDAIDFRPMPNNDARMAALQQGELNMMHTSTMADMAENLATLRDEGAIGLLVSEERTETAYTMINTSVEPLDDLDVRTAIAQAIDRNDLNERANKGFATLADGPFAPGVLGHLNDPGGVEFDLDAARDTVAAMEADGRRTEISLLTSVDPAAVRQAGIQKEMLEAVGFTVELEVELQADLISRVISGDFDLAAFRNQPGDDPDANYNWWYGTSNPVNFGRFDDPVINAALDEGRRDSDAELRREAYETINRRFAEQATTSTSGTRHGRWPRRRTCTASPDPTCPRMAVRPPAAS
jgi:peptide/nickel transport system substrate-binding protein